MLVTRLSHTRPVSWVAALLWMATLFAGIAEPRVSADRRAEPVVAAGVAARVVALDRSFDGLVFAPPEQITWRVASDHRPRSQTTTTLAGAARPRRLAFRYEATAPPRAL